MIAIFENWWKQYKVKVWDIVILEKIEKEAWEKFEIKKVLLVFDENDSEKIEIWVPFTKTTIKAQIVESWKWDKVRVIKFKSKKRYSRNNGHRQPFTKIEILSIW